MEGKFLLPYALYNFAIENRVKPKFSKVVSQIRP